MSQSLDCTHLQITNHETKDITCAHCSKKQVQIVTFYCKICLKQQEDDEPILMNVHKSVYTCKKCKQCSVANPKIKIITRWV